MFSLKTKKDDTTVAGINFSSEGIALAIISHANSHPTLQYAQFHPCTTSEWPTLLAQLDKEHNLAAHSCSLVLSPDEYQLLQVESPDVPSHEQSSAIRWRIKDLIDFHIDDAVIDLITVPGEQASAARSVQVIASRKSVIQRYVDTLHAANYQLNVIDIAEQAARNILTQSVAQTEAVALLNIWEDYARISLYLEGDLYLSRSSSIGLQTLAHIFEKEDIDDASLVVLDSLALELQRTFDYYESHSRQTPIQQLFIQTNSEFPTKLAELIHQRTGIETQQINIDNLINNNIDQIDQPSPQCHLAIGGALRFKS